MTDNEDDDSYEPNNYNELEERISNIENDLSAGGHQISKLMGELASIAHSKLSALFAFIYIPGLVLAMLLSWSSQSSTIWVIVHGYLSWGYVVYHLFF
jgi:hypothetical protein